MDLEVIRPGLGREFSLSSYRSAYYSSLGPENYRTAEESQKRDGAPVTLIPGR